MPVALVYPCKPLYTSNRPRGIWVQNLFVSTQSSHGNHESKMEERSKRYKKIDFLGEGQV